jgi:hypothetical protein
MFEVVIFFVHMLGHIATWINSVLGYRLLGTVIEHLLVIGSGFS